MTTPGYDADLGALAITSAARTEIVFIEDNIADYQTIASQVGAGREVIILDAHADGLQQIVSALAGRTGIDALHIVSHGAAGALNFGALTLDQSTLADHTAQLQAIGSSLTPNGDILLYGCATGAASSFVEQLAIATGADVAASNDSTGSAALGGDWDLEVTSGSIETAGIGSDGLVSAFEGTLGLPSSFTIDFEATNNFTGDWTPDLYYALPQDPSYQLHVTGKDWAQKDQDTSTQHFVTSYGYGGNTEISFKGGQLFSLSSLRVYGTGNNSLKFEAIGNDNNPIASRTWNIHTDTLFPSFSGFDNVKILRVTANDGNPFTFFMFDDLAISNVHAYAADSTPPAVPPAPAFVIGNDTGSSAADGITNLSRPAFTGTAEAGATVKLYDTDKLTLLGSATADSAGKWSITPVSAMAAGPHVLSVTATDAANNTSGFSAPLFVTIDTTAPAKPGTPVLNAGSDSGTLGDNITNDATPTVSGMADAGTTVILYDGSTALGSVMAGNDGRWSITSPTLSSGTHVLTVKATDTAGNTSAASEPLNVTIDTTAPAAPSVPDLRASSDSGISDSDNITADTMPVFTGTAEAGATVTLYAGGTVLGSAVAVDGTWRIASSKLNEGSHLITAQATDAAGNTGAMSAGLTVQIDNTPPVRTFTNLALSNDGGASSTDFVTNVANHIFSGSLDAAPAAGERVEVSLDGGLHWAPAQVDGTNWSAPVTLTAGAGTVHVRVVDAAGNGGSSDGRNYVLDTVAPTLAITSNVAQLKAGETATITFSFSEDPGTSFTLDDVVVSGGTLAALSGSGTVRTAVFTPAKGVDGGIASITVAAGSYTDAAGNAGGAGITPSLHFDTLAPAAPAAPVLDTGSDKGFSNADALTNVSTPTFTGTAENGATVTLYDGATAIGSAAVTDGKWAITSSALGEGSHAITAKLTDAAGNVGAASAATTVTIDTTAPTLAISSDVAQLKAGASATITFTFSEDPGTSFTLHDVVVSGGTLGALSGSGLTRSAVFTPAADIDSGSASITVAAGSYTDAAGNAGGAGTTPVLHFDTLAPAAPSVPDLKPSSDSGISDSDNITADTMPVFTGTAEAGATVTLYAGGTVLGSAVAVDGTWRIASSKLNEGSHLITAQATDAAGNTGAMSAGLTVQIDNTPPVRTFTNLALSNDGGASSTDFVTNVANHIFSGSLDAAPAAGERVEVSLDGGLHWAPAQVDGTNWSAPVTLTAGAGTVHVRVVDAAGNGGSSDGRNYVLDTVAPTLAITSNVAQLKAGETATITFSFSEDPGTSFTLDDVVVSGGTLAALSGSGTVRTAVFTPAKGVDGGIASITVAAGSYTDAAGNAGGAGITPSLHFDTLAPAAPAAPVLDTGSDKGFSNADALTNVSTPTFTGTAENGATVTLYDGATAIGSAAVTDGKWAITSSALGEGSHAITAKLTDAAGNVGAASAATTVTIDTTAPTLAISSDVAQLKAGASATITFTFSEDPGTSFTLHDVVVSGGTLGALSGSGLTRSAVFTPAADIDSGSASITVAAGSYTDAAGNAGGAGTTPVLHFDTLAPAAPSVPDLKPSSDSGISDSDNITADTMPVFTGTAEAGATVTLYEGGTVLGSAIAVDGTWRIASSKLNEGSHLITAQATDAAGNTGAMSAALTVLVDTTAPARTFANLALSNDGGASSTDFVTNVASHVFSGSLDAAPAAGERVEVSLDGGLHWAAAQVDGTNWSAPVTLTAGAGTLSVRVVDAAGNAGAVDSHGYLLDTVAPTLAITSDVAQLNIGATATITFTFSEDPGTSFTLDDVVVSGGSLAALSGSGTVRTAVFTPTNGVDGGVASISVAPGLYRDAAGNAGSAGTTPVLRFDTRAPDAPAAPALDGASDSGIAGDGITGDATPTVRGTAEAQAVITLYDSDGTTVLGMALADVNGAWHIGSSVLADGDHTLRAVQTDRAGNVSALGAALKLTIDTLAAAPAAPVLLAASDSGAAGDGITKVNTPTVTGRAEALAQVSLYDTDGQTVVGTTQAGADGTWSITARALADGVHALSVKQVDVAGNVSSASLPLSLTIDTVAPNAPAAPQLSAASDTGRAGDGITFAIPVLEGSVQANALVTVYEGQKVLGTAAADAQGHWQLEVRGLALGAHTITATQTDAAGNVSGASGNFVLTLRPGPVQVDGVSVTTNPVTLPGGVSGSQLEVPIVGAGRVDTSGQASTADIPLATSGSTNLLVAQVSQGYGLTAVGGANAGVGSAASSLNAAIQAATQSNSVSDQVHLAGNATNFLAKLASVDSLLVQTVTPVSSPAPTGMLTLSGTADAQQHTALVIQAAGLAQGSTIALQNVDFAAVIGSANVVAQSGIQMLSGDAASQHFMVEASSGTQVFAGGGNDALSFGLPASVTANGVARAQSATPVQTTTVLHGGAGDDTAIFNGVRADFDVETHNGYLLVSSKAAPGTKAMVINAEQLQFDDAVVHVDSSASMTTLAAVYQAALGRQADVYGIEFWGNVADRGVSLGEIAVQIIGSAERTASHDAFNGNIEHDIGLLYAGLFNRAADAEGLAYWAGAMRNGATLEQVADGMAHSAELIGQQVAPTGWNFIA